MKSYILKNTKKKEKVLLYQEKKRLLFYASQSLLSGAKNYSFR